MPKLMKLKSIIPNRGIFSLATKEKAWQFFQGIYAELTESVKAMVGDQQLAACVIMFAAEEPIRLNSGRSSDFLFLQTLYVPLCHLTKDIFMLMLKVLFYFGIKEIQFFFFISPAC